MLNRRQLRIKVLQALYAYNRSQSESYSVGEKELFHSLEKIYDMYIFYLLIFGELKSFAEFRIDENKKKRLPTEEDLNPNLRFVNHPIIAQLESNAKLKNLSENRKINWMGERELIRKLYYTIVEDETYLQYMQLPETDFEQDRQFLVKLFKSIIANFELAHHFFEERSIYWVDDIDFVCSMIIKTLKGFDELDSKSAEILDLFKDEKDERDFAKTLFRSTIVRDEELEELIKKHSQNWEIERIATMDILLMKLAMTEAQEFNTIPLKVTLNEYIDISKFYSTPKSKGFINGILDRGFTDLESNGQIKKIGRGLIG